MKLFLLCLCSLSAIVAGQRITTIQLDGVQYFISRMNPYSPELNYFLSYQYCRSLGLQLASFETKEKVESMSQYLQNAGYSKYDFWTSGNRLGTGMFLWMSTGLPFNATFDYFENSHDAVSTGQLDPIDHNSNTSPQRTARDSSSGLEKGCVMLQAPGLRWAPEDCSAVKDFICEQTRCYYYNYGSIPVSSAQGRPIAPSPSTTIATPITAAPTTTTTSAPIPSTTSTTTAAPPTTTTTEPSTTVKQLYTTPLPLLKAASTAVPVAPLIEHIIASDASASDDANAADDDDLPAPYGALKHFIESSTLNEATAAEEDEAAAAAAADEDDTHHDDTSAPSGEEAADESAIDASASGEHDAQQQEDDASASGAEHDNDTSADDEDQSMLPQYAHEELLGTAPHLDHFEHIINSNDDDGVPATVQAIDGPKIEQTTTVEQRLRKISEEIEKYSSSEADADLGRQSFFTLSDLIKTLRPSDKKVHPQIDGDYSNTMRVLGDQQALIGAEGRQMKGVEISTAQRSYQ